MGSAGSASYNGPYFALGSTLTAIISKMYGQLMVRRFCYSTLQPRHTGADNCITKLILDLIENYVNTWPDDTHQRNVGTPFHFQRGFLVV